MKIYELNINGEKEWIAAHTIINALQVYLSISSMHWSEFEQEDDIIEIPESKWGEYKITNEDEDVEMTFAEWMDKNSAPDLIASTA